MTPHLGIIGLGTVAGFLIGYLTRPSLFGRKYPLSLLTSTSPMDEPFRAELFQHLALCTALGLVCAAALVWLLAASKKI